MELAPDMLKVEKSISTIVYDKTFVFIINNSIETCVVIINNSIRTLVFTIKIVVLPPSSLIG
jgi:hypothetical protein